MSNLSEFSEIEKDFNKFIVKYPKEAKKFLKAEARKISNISKKKAKSQLKLTKGKKFNKKGKEVKTYLKGFKVGKVFEDVENGTTVRAYNSAKHAHLIELGTVNRSNKKGANRGYIRGYRILEKSKNEFKDKFEQDCVKFVDQIIEKGGY